MSIHVIDFYREETREVHVHGIFNPYQTYTVMMYDFPNNYIKCNYYLQEKDAVQKRKEMTQIEKNILCFQHAGVRASVPSNSHLLNEAIHDLYRNLSFERRRYFIVSNVRQVPQKRVTDTQKQSRRSNTVIWSLGITRRFASLFSCTHLDIQCTCDKVVLAALKNASIAVVSSDSEVIVGAQGDGRGHHEPTNKFPEDYCKQVMDHIESYRPQISHYKREHAPFEQALSAFRSVSSRNAQTFLWQEKRRKWNNLFVWILPTDI